MDIISRLKNYLDAYGITNSEFADNCGIPRPTVSQMLNGRNKKVSDEIITKIHQNYPALSMLWLLFGEGDMMMTSKIETTEPQNQSNNDVFDLQYSDSKGLMQRKDSGESNSINSSEKISENMFTYYVSGKPDNSQNAAPAASQSNSYNNDILPPESDDKSNLVNIPADPLKRITNIVVFYSDNSFQSFRPAGN